MRAKARRTDIGPGAQRARHGDIGPRAVCARRTDIGPGAQRARHGDIGPRAHVPGAAILAQGRNVPAATILGAVCRLFRLQAAIAATQRGDILVKCGHVHEASQRQARKERE